MMLLLLLLLFFLFFLPYQSNTFNQGTIYMEKMVSEILGVR